MLVAGAAAAFQMMGRRSPTETPPPQTTPKKAEPAAVEPVEPAEPAPARPADLAPAAAPAQTPSRSRPTPVAGKHESGPGEIQLLTRARESDVRGDYGEVLAILAEHERRYPAGRLSEEREVLRVKALVGLERGGEARRTAARFRQHFPRSVLLRKVDEILTTLP
jgi:hypothetical protein